MPIHPAPNVVIAERFRLNRLLGRGGMGSVWHATHLGLDVPCAVKFIEGEGADLPEVQGRFEREAKAAAQLRSPHVVQILDHGLCNGTPYIAMELLDGEDLGKRLTRQGRLPPHDLLAIVTQVARALTRAHAVGIVHRDLKPDNIFLVRDDDREIAKVLDFGIAKAMGSGAPGSNTRTGAMLGTPYYMSPEQAQGTKAVDARSDLWSLAVIVFEALTGHRPFESEALGDLLMKIIVAPIPSPSRFAPDLAPGLDAWWARASHRDPAQRFQSAKDLCDSLAVALGRTAGDLVHAAPPPADASGGHPQQPVFGSTPQPRVVTATGAPIARTFGASPPGAKGRTAMVVAIGGAVVALGTAIVGISFVVKARDATPAARVLGSGIAPPDAMVALPPATTAAPPIVAAAATVSAALMPAAAPPPSSAAGGRDHAPAEVGEAPLVAPGHSPKPDLRPVAPWVKAPAAPKPPPPAIAPPTTKPAPAPIENKKKSVDLGI